MPTATGSFLERSTPPYRQEQKKALQPLGPERFEICRRTSLARRSHLKRIDVYTATVLVDATRAALVVDDLGPDAVVERRDDGAVVVRLEVVNREAFRTWVLELLEHAEVLTPPELRDEIVSWLEAQAGTGAASA